VVTPSDALVTPSDPEMIHTVVWRLGFSETRFGFSDMPTSK
jgi:hypothetical protein